MAKSTSYIVDTNVFLRFLTNDNKDQAKKVEIRFLEAKKNKIQLRVLLITVVEILFHLERWYKFSKKDAISKIEDLFIHEWMKVESKDVLFASLEEYRTKNIDFVDLLTYHSAVTSRSKILSFDKDFDELDPFAREAP